MGENDIPPLLKSNIIYAFYIFLCDTNHTFIFYVTTVKKFLANLLIFFFFFNLEKESAVGHDVSSNWSEGTNINFPPLDLRYWLAHLKTGVEHYLMKIQFKVGAKQWKDNDLQCYMDRLLSYTNYNYFSSHGVNDTELIIARCLIFILEWVVVPPTQEALIGLSVR